MNLWTRPAHYAGATWNGWCVSLGRNRDSGIIENSNFESALALLRAAAGDAEVDDTANGETESMAALAVVRESHFLCGWVEWIAIHSSCTPAVAEGERIEERLESYPILDDDDVTTREGESYWEQWRNGGFREFCLGLERAGLVETDALDEVTPEAAMEAFELLIPSGDYHDGEGAPRVGYAIEQAKRIGLDNAVCELLGLETEGAK